MVERITNMIFGKKWLEEKHRQYESQTWAKLSIMFRNFIH